MAASSLAERLKSREKAEKARRIPCPYRAGDVVYVISGKEKGKFGNFQKYVPKKNQVFVEGLNLIERYVKPRQDINREGGRMSLECPIHVSNTAYYCRSCSKPSSLRRRVQVSEENGRKSKTVTWVCRRCGEAREPRKKT
ncbi:MAG: 50S ribosomal protein L24 [Deltaproteobacteria bacterium]|jgi:large subunit ribosomal protein L24|nr:50S ribosomal protein L24 [Deltaproteobacteria bacterium]